MTFLSFQERVKAGREHSLPANYPLPIHGESGFAYYEINLLAILLIPEWSAYQRSRRMDQIISRLDELLIGEQA